MRGNLRALISLLAFFITFFKSSISFSLTEKVVFPDLSFRNGLSTKSSSNWMTFKGKCLSSLARRA